MFGARKRNSALCTALLIQNTPTPTSSITKHKAIMRVISSILPVLGCVSLATFAVAATGDFSYSYIGPDGKPNRAELSDPNDQVCITIPGAADPYESQPAYAPENSTDKYAIVFTEPDCTGDSFVLKPHGRPTTDRLKLRSVTFISKQ